MPSVNTFNKKGINKKNDHTLCVVIQTTLQNQPSQHAIKISTHNMRQIFFFNLVYNSTSKTARLASFSCPLQKPGKQAKAHVSLCNNYSYLIEMVHYAKKQCTLYISIPFFASSVQLTDLNFGCQSTQGSIATSCPG